MNMNYNSTLEFITHYDATTADQDDDDDFCLRFQSKHICDYYFVGSYIAYWVHSIIAYLALSTYFINILKLINSFRIISSSKHACAVLSHLLLHMWFVDSMLLIELVSYSFLLHITMFTPIA